MPDEPSPKPFIPAERNARRLVNILAQQHSSGLRCEDLNREFQQVTKLQRQSFYDALGFAKKQSWITGGGQRQEYTLNSNGCWREALKSLSVGEPLEKYQLEHLLSLEMEKVELLEATNRRLSGARKAEKAAAAGEASGSTVTTLVQLMADQTVTTRRQLQAAELLLGYRTPEDVATAAKVFLSSLASDPEQNVDYRLAALAALRKVEDPRIAPSVERPTVAVRTDTPAEIAERHEQQLRHIEEQARINAEELRQEQERFAGGRSQRTTYALLIRFRS
jgi:hypothetical protein